MWDKYRTEHNTCKYSTQKRMRSQMVQMEHTNKLERTIAFVACFFIFLLLNMYNACPDFLFIAPHMLWHCTHFAASI